MLKLQPKDRSMAEDLLETEIPEEGFWPLVCPRCCQDGPLTTASLLFG